MFSKKINIWYISSLLISVVVAIPIVTVFSSFFESTGNYSSIMRDTFLYDYIFNSLILLIGVLILTFIIGVGCAYLVSFYKFPDAKFRIHLFHKVRRKSFNKKKKNIIFF